MSRRSASCSGVVPAAGLPAGNVATAIVIGFATTALYLVMIIGARGLTGSDHVDGEEPRE